MEPEKGMELKRMGQNLFFRKCGKSLSSIVATGDLVTYARTKTEITMKEAFSHGMKIGEAKKYNRDLTEDVISFIIIDLGNALNVGKNFSSYQVLDLTLQIINDYSHLTIEEVIVVFENFKRGRYGKLYDRLDGQIVNEIILKYEGEERADLLEKEHSKIKNQDKLDLKITGSAGSFVSIAVRSSHPDTERLRKHFKDLKEKSKKVIDIKIPHLESIQKWQAENEKLLPTLTDNEILKFRDDLKKGIKIKTHNSNYRDILKKVESEIVIRKEKLLGSLPELSIESLRSILSEVKNYNAQDIQVILRDELLVRQNKNKSQSENRINKTLRSIDT